MNEEQVIETQETAGMLLTEALYFQLRGDLTQTVADLLEENEGYEKNLSLQEQELEAKEQEIKDTKKEKKKNKKIYVINFFKLRKSKSNLRKINNLSNNNTDKSWTLTKVSFSNIHKKGNEAISFDKEKYMSQQEEIARTNSRMKAQRVTAQKQVEIDSANLQAIKEVIDSIVEKLKEQKRSKKEIIEILKGIKKQIDENAVLIEENSKLIDELDKLHFGSDEPYISEEYFIPKTK